MQMSEGFGIATKIIINAETAAEFRHFLEALHER